MPEATSRARAYDRPGRKSPVMRLAVLLLISAASCNNTRELTRDQAAEMLRNSEVLRTPTTLALKKEADWNVRPVSATEPESAALDRAAENYYQAYPQMDVLRRLGMMDVRATIREKPGENYGVWSFDIEPFLTEKGKELPSSGREDQGVLSIRLAQMELVEVTGIIKSSDQTAQAEYTWKEVPTAAGRAFSLGSPEYESLPAALRQALRERNQTRDFDKVRRGRAVFQLYDDGWRLLSAQ